MDKLLDFIRFNWKLLTFYSLEKLYKVKYLVVWPPTSINLPSTTGVKFNPTQLAKIEILKYYQGVIVGLLLSDG